MPKHETLTPHAYDSEALEDALAAICNGYLPISCRLELRRLSMSLWYGTEQQKQRVTHLNHDDTLECLTNFRANLHRRKKASDLLTRCRLIDIPEPAQTILLSDIAFTFRDEIDDYNQIDFNNIRHVELLSFAVDRSISKVGNKRGRPVNGVLDEFFIGLRDLYEGAAGKKAVATAHFNNQPKTDFEKLMHLGYQIIRPAQTYPSALKAYERAINRNS